MSWKEAGSDCSCCLIRSKSSLSLNSAAIEAQLSVCRRLSNTVYEYKTSHCKTLFIVKSELKNFVDYRTENSFPNLKTSAKIELMAVFGIISEKQISHTSLI